MDRKASLKVAKKRRPSLVSLVSLPVLTFGTETGESGRAVTLGTTPVAPAPRPEHTKLTSTCTRAPYDIHSRLYIRARLNGAHALPEVLRCELWQPVSLDLRHVSHVEAGGEEELVEDDAANAPREEHRRRVH